MDKPIITGIGQRKKFDHKIALLKSTDTTDQSRSPISGDTCEKMTLMTCITHLLHLPLPLLYKLLTTTQSTSNLHPLHIAGQS